MDILEPVSEAILNMLTHAHREISPDDLHQFAMDFHAEPRNQIALNAVTKTPLTQVAMSRRAVVRFAVSRAIGPSLHGLAA